MVPLNPSLCLQILFPSAELESIALIHLSWCLCIMWSNCNTSAWVVGLQEHECQTGTSHMLLTVHCSKFIIEHSLPNAVDMCALWQGGSVVQLFQESNSMRKLPGIAAVDEAG